MAESLMEEHATGSSFRALLSWSREEFLAPCGEQGKALPAQGNEHQHGHSPFHGVGAVRILPKTSSPSVERTALRSECPFLDLANTKEVPAKEQFPCLLWRSCVKAGVWVETCLE